MKHKNRRVLASKLDIRLAIGVLLLFFLGRAWAQETLKVDALISREEALLGDVLSLMISIDRPNLSRIKPPDVKKALSNFEVKDFNISEKKLKGNKIRTVLRYTIIPFQTGDLKIGPVFIPYTSPDQKKQELKTEVLSVRIKSLMDPRLKEINIRGPKPVLSLKRSFLWLYSVIFVMSLIVIGLWMWMGKRAKEKYRPVTTSIPALSPSDEALKRLENLARSDDFQKGRMREVYSQLSEILRHYLGRRYGIHALEMTTMECVKELKFLKLSSEVMNKIRMLLSEADLVKFAKYVPSQEELPIHLREEIDVVDQTKEEVSHAS